jgi:hypothetical protein
MSPRKALPSHITKGRWGGMIPCYEVTCQLLPLETMCPRLAISVLQGTQIRGGTVPRIIELKV